MLLLGFVDSCTGWRLRLQNGLHSNNQSLCTYLTDELCQVADVEARQW